MTTIRQQLTRRLLLLFLFLPGLCALGIYFTFRAALLREFDHALLARAGALASAARPENGRLEFDFRDELFRGFDRNVKSDFFEIWNTNGAPLERSDSLDGTDLPKSEAPRSEPAFWNLTLPAGTAGRAVGFQFVPGDTEDDSPRPAAAPAIIVVASNRAGLDRTLAMVAVLLAVFNGLMLAATAVAVPRLLRRGLAPLNQLGERAAQITAESLSDRFPMSSLPGELLPISTSLNNLLSRLSESFDRERQFSADLSHELRTPIAELRSLIELTLKWPEDPAARNDAEMLAITTQMEGIVNRLLALLRSERGQIPLTQECMETAELIRQVWRPFSGKVSDKKINLAIQVPTGLEIETDRVLLCSILTTLADNAVEYTPGGSEINVIAKETDDAVDIRITNSTVGLSSKDLPHLFDRFWRKDSARSGNEHAGLGLSLARSFARVLQGELAASMDTENRLTLTLSLPRKSKPGRASSVSSLPE